MLLFNRNAALHFHVLRDQQHEAAAQYGAQYGNLCSKDFTSKLLRNSIYDQEQLQYSHNRS